jgi:hypothetical protein
VPPHAILSGNGDAPAVWDTSDSLAARDRPVFPVDNESAFWYFHFSFWLSLAKLLMARALRFMVDQFVVVSPAALLSREVNEKNLYGVQ